MPHLMLLLALAQVHAQSCGLPTSTSALVHDVSEAAQAAWAASVEDALGHLTDELAAATAKDEAHAVAEDVRRARDEGSISAEDASRLLDALSYIWHRADELEDGWKALAEGKFTDAKDLAKKVADRVRGAYEQGFLTEEQRDVLLGQAWRLWNMADGLARSEALIAKSQKSEAKALAHETAEQARSFGSYRQLTAEQQAAVEAQAGRLYTMAAKDGTKTSAMPYYSQYDNGINPGGSCQNTSIAMVLEAYGVHVLPDDISRRFGTSYAQSPEGVASVFNTYAAEAGIPQRMVAHRDGTVAGMNSLLDQGKPVIVHGYFTGYGHVLVATGRDANSYTVNDPAGVWSQRWKGGYSGSYNGRGVHYGADAFLDAVATWDGSTPAPLWYGEIVTR
ncbi:MAG: C39 family peptidase [Pseudomonadota bacterium]